MEVKLPAVGEGIAEAEIVKWHVAAGQQVQADEPLVEVLTDKASVEIPAPIDGLVSDIRYQEGDLVPVGQTLLVLQAIQDVGGLRAVPTPSSSSVLAAPSTRRLAREQGIELAGVKGSGPYGRILHQDVLAASPAAPVPEPRPLTGQPEERIPLRGIRRKIAEHMVKSKFTIPEFMYADEVDMTELVEFRAGIRGLLEERELKLTFLPFIIKAVTAALRRYPFLNARLDEERQEIVLKKEYHIGFAAATDKGLMVPVLRQADRLSVPTLAREIARLSQAVRQGTATVEELQGSTFTITNIGAIGGIMSVPIINYPEVAILGVNKVYQKPVVFKGEIAIRWVSTFSLCFDHRVVDGIDGARFTEHVKTLLENPKLLMLEEDL